ncbi:MAG: hypothetical protein EOP84_14945 [Verrucomicrobiaceae bacterium]|nr:MAG: hypothetical protein EOP84_14945 [Verrucomicrobiaceae bacterium]
MSHITILFLIFAFLAPPSFGFSEHVGDKDLAEVARMKGVEVVYRRGESADVHFHGRGLSHDKKDLFGLSIGLLLPENDLLGKGFLKPLKVKAPSVGSHELRLRAVELFGIDQTGRTIFITQLQFPQVQGGNHFKGINAAEYIWFQFAIDKQLMERSFLRLIERVGHGIQWTDVYLGSKPGTPPEAVAARASEIDAQPVEHLFAPGMEELLPAAP